MASASAAADDGAATAARRRGGGGGDGDPAEGPGAGAGGGPTRRGAAAAAGASSTTWGALWGDDRNGGGGGAAAADNPLGGGGGGVRRKARASGPGLAAALSPSPSPSPPPGAALLPPPPPPPPGAALPPGPPPLAAAAAALLLGHRAPPLALGPAWPPGVARRLWVLAWPLCWTEVLSFAKELIVTACVGRWLGPGPLAALVLGQTLYNVTGNAPVLGVVTAMETYCGQAYGARRFSLLGATLQRALALSLLVSAGAALLWARGGALLAATGQDPVIAAAAGRFTAALSPALAMDAADQCVRRFLAAQGVARPLMAVTVAATAACPVFLWLFLRVLPWGLMGAAAAWNATQATSLLLMVGVARVHVRGQPAGRKAWAGWSVSEATSGWVPYLRMAAPSVVMICLDWWTFEIVVMLSGLLPNPGEEGMGVCFHRFAFFLVPFFFRATERAPFLLPLPKKNSRHPQPQPRPPLNPHKHQQPNKTKRPQCR